MTHDGEHERWLEQQAADGFSMVDRQVQARIAECPECAARLSEEHSAAAELARAGEVLREDLRAAREERGAPGEDRISASALGVPGRRPRGARRFSPLAATLLAAAAGLIAWVWIREPRATEPTPSYLGDSLVLGAPKGPGADFSVFRWDGVVPPSGWFVVVIRDEKGAELIRSPRLARNEFLPPTDVALPDAIEWRVESHDTSGLREAVTTRASRR